MAGMQSQGVQQQQQQQQHMTPMTSAAPQDVPLVTFGTFGDVQHSCKRNGVKIRGPRVRNRYNETSLELMCQALEDWKCSPVPVSFLLNLGNLSELHDEAGYDRDQALVEVLNNLERFPRPKYHVLGHHDLKQFTRREFMNSKLHSAVNSPGAVPASHDKFFYHFSPTPGVRIVVIDTLEVALVGYDDNQKASEYKRAVDTVRRKNCNLNCRETEGMSWQDSKYTCINGASTNIQLQWLVEVLDYAEKNGEIVVCAGHNPLCASDKQRYSFVPWNNDEIMGVLHKYPCVVAYFAGHDCDGGYIQDDAGIHHITMPGIVETPPCSNAHATVHVLKDRLEIKGTGRCPSMSLYYRGKAEIAPPAPTVQPAPLALAPVAPQQVIMPVQKVPVGLASCNFGTVRAHGGTGAAEVTAGPLHPGKVRPPPIVMAELERNAELAQQQQPMAHGMVQPQMIHQPQVLQVPQAGCRRAIPVTVAVPIDKLKAMGGVEQFQLAPPPADLSNGIEIGGATVYNLNQQPAGKCVSFATHQGQQVLM